MIEEKVVDIQQEAINYLAELLLERPKSPEMVVAIAKLYKEIMKY